MKLNQDCVRQVLLDMENNLTMELNIPLNKVINSSTFEKYGEDTVAYSLLKLKEAEYIDGRFSYGNDKLVLIRLSSITWEGHKFLDNIRDSQVWSKTKKIAKELESVSITLISNIASQVITNLVIKNIQ